MDKKKTKNGKHSWTIAIVCILLVIGSVFYGFREYRKRTTDYIRPLPDSVFPVISKQQQKILYQAVRFAGRTYLKVTPTQEQQIEALAKEPPRSLEELIEFNKKIDSVLTPEQRAKALPLRRELRSRVIDRMLQSASKRFPPGDFEKFKNEIKARVTEKVEGQ